MDLVTDDFGFTPSVRVAPTVEVFAVEEGLPRRLGGGSGDEGGTEEGEGDERADEVFHGGNGVEETGRWQRQSGEAKENFRLRARCCGPSGRACGQTNGKNFAATITARKPTVPMIENITDIVRSVSRSVRPEVFETTQKPLSFIHGTSLEAQPIVRAR